MEKDSEQKNGADGQIRTGDLILTKDALYLLSYISITPRGGNKYIIHLFLNLARGILKKIGKISANFADLPFLERFVNKMSFDLPEDTSCGKLSP